MLGKFQWEYVQEEIERVLQIMLKYRISKFQQCKLRVYISADSCKGCSKNSVRQMAKNVFLVASMPDFHGEERGSIRDGTTRLAKWKKQQGHRSLSEHCGFHPPPPSNLPCVIHLSIWADTIGIFSAEWSGVQSQLTASIKMITYSLLDFLSWGSFK